VLFVFLQMSIFIMAAGTAYSAVAPGTRIINIAESTAKDPVSGNIISLPPSNEVLAEVQAITLRLSKKTSNTSPNKGETVDFTLTLRNISNAQAIGVPVIVDGVSQRLVIVRDAIPANTSFAGFRSGPQQFSLYHRIGDPVDNYSLTLPADPELVDAVAFGFSSYSANQAMDLTFSVRIHDNAEGSIINKAAVSFNDGTADVTARSNVVILIVHDAPSPTPEIHFYTNFQFGAFALVTRISDPLYVMADAAACNTKPVIAEEKKITIRSLLTGDSETYIGTETGPNTGYFRILTAAPARLDLQWVPTRDASLNPVLKGNGIIETLKNDTLTAVLHGCGTATVTTEILIDPYGVLFDSKTNNAVAGADVTLIDVTGQGNGGKPNQPAHVFLPDGITSAPSTVTTASDGQFQFPLVRESTYRLAIKAPNGYSFPSLVPAGLQPRERTIDLAGSYGKPFAVNASTGTIRIDVPLDPAPASGLFIEKKASRSVAEIGDFVDYSIIIRNNSGKPIPDVRLRDRLPAGFAYQKGTARLDRKAIADPFGGSGPNLEFSLGDLAPDKMKELAYRVLIGPGSMEGDGINSVYAAASDGTASNSSMWRVLVQGGVFSDRGYIFGKVFVDCNKNGIQDAVEQGIPGVRLYLEDGTFSVTDGDGKYSIYGISARTHVIKVDPVSLPIGSVLMPISNRHAGAGGSRFVDLRRGEMHKADFAEGICSEDVLQQVRSRRDEADALVAETQKTVMEKLSLSADTRTGSDLKSQPASGILGQGTQSARYEPLVPNVQNSGFVLDVLPADQLTALPFFDFENRLPNMDATPAFVDIKDGDLLPYRQANVVIKGPGGARFELYVNGTIVPEHSVGKKARVESTAVEAWEYVGVNLDAGMNELKFVVADQFGNARGSVSVRVTAPGNLAKIRIAVPNRDVPANGTAGVKIAVTLTDDKGNPVTVRTPVTMEAGAGQWRSRDINETEPGLQSFIEGGSAEFILTAPAEPGETLIRATSGSVRSEAVFYFAPDLRPLVAAGVVEGVINFRKLDPNAIVPSRHDDGFEEELQSLSFSSDNGRTEGAGRASFFIKGKIRGDYLLTLAYDSDKDTKERLFRDIQPDEFYPVYGDSSVRGFDAQSTNRLYVRIDKNRSYLLYGDFTTQSAFETTKLGAYQRSLTGLKGHYEDKTFNLTAYASRDNARQVIDEIPGRGISGPYYLKNANIIQNSEKVEIIVRDRNQPSIIIRTTPQARFTDYEIDHFTGQLLFRAPVPSLDEDLNPVYIRVVYEVEQGGEEFWTAGAEARGRITDRVEVGGTFAKDENPQDKLQMESANISVKLAEKTFLIGEWAQIRKESTGSGDGARVELRHTSDDFEAIVQASRTDPEFDNPSSGIGKGRFDSNIKFGYRVTPKAIVRLEGIRSEDLTTDAKREGVMLNLEYSVSPTVRAEVGMRYSRENPVPADGTTVGVDPYDFTSLRMKLASQVPYVPQMGIYGEYEQAVDDPERKLAAIGGEYKITDLGRIYARHEFISSIGGEFTLNEQDRRNVTLVGLDTRYMKDGTMFSEYRVKDGISGRDAEAAIGLRNNWDISKGFRINTSIERIQAVKGSTSGTSTAVAAGMEYFANPRWKGTGRIEFRTSPETDSILSTLGLAYKVNKNITFLGRNIYSLIDNKGGVGDRAEGRLQLGMAYRPAVTNVWNALAKYEFRFEKDSTVSSLSIRRKVSILSMHLNYQAGRRLIMSGRYAGKLVFERSNGIASTSNAHLLSIRSMYDITDQWDAGIITSALFRDMFRSAQYGLGAEVGYLAAKNIRVSVGYNVLGFEDKDLTSEEYTNPGMFMRLRYKFDEELISMIGGPVGITAQDTK
jgi:uncharacterized repeat protein (TIGR01451 family)